VVVDGTPVDALRAFRERYNVQAGQDPEHGDRRLEIIKTIITDGEGRPKDRFVPGDSLGIEFEVLAHETTDDWVAGIAITNHLDLLVYGTNTKLQGIDLPPLEGRRRVKFLFDDLPMVEGQYYVTTAVHPKVGPEYHRLDRAVSFKVYSDAADVGVLHLSPRFEVAE
jgi:ABC-2 type transport system ATP-binding protein